MIRNPISSINDFHKEKYGHDHPKIQRGWGTIYDVIFNNLNDKIDVVTEIGIGNASCHLAWAQTFPGKKVVGIDIASPSLELCDIQNCDVPQYVNSMRGITNLHRASMSDISNIDLYYNKNGYTKDIADQYLSIYGKQSFFINDGKQDGLAHIKFREFWGPILTGGGLLLQERIARSGNNGIRIHQMIKAIRNGWLVYDCREYVKFENPNANGFLGIWTEDVAHWTEILKDFKRITDPVAEIEKEFQLVEKDML